MGKLRCAKPKVRAAKPRIRAVPLDGRSEGLIERHTFYASPVWTAVRKDSLRRHPRCLACGARATFADHGYGHDDRQAAEIAALYGIAIPPHWRDRLTWPPGLHGLCRPCHDAKSGLERAGRLAEWFAQKPYLVRATQGPR